MDLDQNLLNKSFELSNRIIVPDIRCVCKKVIPEITRLAYQNEFVPGSIASAKDFMKKYGINRVCCMNTLFNPTSFPLKRTDIIDAELSKSFKNLTDFDIRLNSYFIELNNLYQKYTNKTYPEEKILMELEDFFEDKLFIYDVDLLIQESYKERFYVSKENKNIPQIIEILKDYSKNLAKRKGISKVDSRKINLNVESEQYRRIKILNYAKTFIFRKNNYVENAANLLTDIFMEVFPDTYISKDPTFLLELKKDFSLEDILKSRDKFIDLCMKVGTYPIFSDIPQNYYSLDTKENITYIIQRQIPQQDLLDRILSGRDYTTEKLKDKTIYTIKSLNHDEILVLEKGILTLERKYKTSELDLSLLTGGDVIMAKMMNFFNPERYDKLLESYKKRLIDIEIMGPDSTKEIIYQQDYFDLEIPQTKLGLFVLDKIYYLITEFKHYALMIKSILKNIDKLQYYYYGLLELSKKYISKNKLNIVLNAEDNYSYVKKFNTEKPNLDSSYVKYMENLIEELDSMNVYDILNFKLESWCDFFYSGIVSNDPNTIMNYLKSDIFTEKRIRLMYENRDRSIRMFDFYWVYELWEFESFIDFLDKLKKGIKQCVELFDYKIVGPLDPYTKKILKNFPEFEIPKYYIVEKYNEIIENYNSEDQEDPNMEEAYLYLTDPSKKLPTSSGYVIGAEEYEGDQAEQAQQIEMGVN